MCVRLETPAGCGLTLDCAVLILDVHWCYFTIWWWWRGDATTPALSNCDGASRQRLADSLGRSKSKDVRLYIFRSTADLPCQAKLQKYSFPGIVFRQQLVCSLG